MAGTCTEKTVSFKDLTDKKDVSITGRGTYFIGLSQTGEITIGQEDDMCITLLGMCIQSNGGCVLSGASQDFMCIVNNEEELEGEINLVDGMKLEIADRVLLFIDGPVPKLRRKLPQTPGTMVGEAPAKPARKTVEEAKANTDDNTETQQLDSQETEDQKWLETSWCVLDLSTSDQQMFSDLHTPEQISIVAASYFTKQLRLFTDAVVTTKLLDDIFKLFMDTITDCRDTYMNYLSDVSSLLAKVPDKSNSRPMHGPAVKFLVELLKLILEPVERVILLLDLIRTFSHFDYNLVAMVRCQATATVLGSMSAYLDVIEVQRYGADILAKLATYTPVLGKKAPVREVAVDMIARGVKYHSKDLALSRSACRVLANLSLTLITVLNNWLDTGNANDTNLQSDVEKYEVVLLYLFQEGIPLVQAIMKSFSHDLGVCTEGRKFIFYYAKLPQLQLKKSKWLQTIKTMQDDSTNDLTTADDSSPNTAETTHNANMLPGQLLSGETRETVTHGILKNRRTYESQRSKERKIIFADDTVGGSESELTSSSESESEAEPELTAEQKATSIVNGENDGFSTHVVGHFVKKVIRMKSQEENDGDAEESDSDQEFLQSLSMIPKESSDTEHLEQPETVNNTESASVNNGLNSADGGNDMEKEGNLNAADISSKTDAGESNVEMNDSLSQKGNGDGIQKFRGDGALLDVAFLGKLVRTQIIVYVGSLKFQGEDSKVLMVIDQPIATLLESAEAPPGLVEFAGNQYGSSMTLMDLEPSMVISVIDAVRYRDVTQDLVYSAVLSLTRGITGNLQESTIQLVMMFYKGLFADQHLSEILTAEEFIKEFRQCFQNATDRMESFHSIEEIRKKIASPSLMS